MSNEASFTPMVNAILSVFHSASLVEVAEGKRWYPLAQEIAQEMADKYGVTLSTAAALVAILSPQKRWEQNIEEAERVLEILKRTGDASEAALTAKLFCTGVQRQKVLKLLTGTAALELITSQKVQAFYLLILNGGEGGRVCVDGHASNIAHNGMKRMGITEAKRMTPKQYDAIAQAYNEAGAAVGLTGAAMQAVTWVAYRNL